MACGWTNRQAGKATSFGLSEPPSSSLPKAESRPSCGRWTLTLTTVCSSKRSIPESGSLVDGLRGSSEVAQPRLAYVQRFGPIAIITFHRHSVYRMDNWQCSNELSVYDRATL